MEEFMEHLFMGNPFLGNPFMGTPFMENPTFLRNPFMGQGDHFTSDFEKSSVILESGNFQRFCFERVKQLSVDEKIQVVYDYLAWSKKFPAMQQQLPKSTDQASQFRMAGNKAFNRKDYQGALIYYTESVAVAPADSEELALAYGNRSAVFMFMEKYEECLLEVNRALKEKYPEAKKQKLRERKGKCVQRLKDTFNTIRLLPRAVLNTLRGQSTLEEFMKSFNPDNTEPPDYQNLLIPKISCENKTIPNASNKIKLKIRNTGDNKVGIFATANIKPGEVIAIEKPVAFAMYEQFTRSHCAYCFRRMEALIPCENCSMVMFCSTHCRKNACNEFHEVECQIFCGVSLNEGSIMLKNWAHLRLLLVITKQGRVLDEIMDQYERPLGKNLYPNLKEKFNSQNCSSVLLYGRLSMNNSLIDLNTGFDMILFLNAVQFLYVLKNTTFFDKQRANNQNLDGKLTNRELYVAAFLMKCIQNDCYSINEGIKRTSVPQPVGGKLVTLNIGHGMYPLLNNFGPSCEPHVRVFCHGNSLVCRAIRSIKAGEEILNSYCGLFSVIPKYERASVCMRLFNFVCTCKPCRQDWPTDEMLPNTSSKVISDSIGAKKFQEYYSRFQKLWENPFDDALGSLETREFLIEYLSILEKRFEKPCREINKCDHLLSSHFRMTANYYLVE